MQELKDFNIRLCKSMAAYERNKHLFGKYDLVLVPEVDPNPAYPSAEDVVNVWEFEEPKDDL